MNAPALVEPRSTTTTARQRLAEHLARVRAAEGDVSAARIPVDRVRATLEAAAAREASARQALAELDQQHAQSIASLAIMAAPADAGDAAVAFPAPQPQQLRADVAEAERMLDVTGAALAQVTRAHDAAVARLSQLWEKGEEFAIAVLAEEHADAMQRLAVARREVERADADARAIVQALYAEGRRRGPSAELAWFRCAEQLSGAYAASPVAFETSKMFEIVARWSDVIARLRDNPEARP